MLKKVAPNGIDIYFENRVFVISKTVLQQINLGAKIPLIRLIIQCKSISLPTVPNLLPLLIKRALIKFFLVSNYQHCFFNLSVTLVNGCSQVN